jgi:carbon storage regulator
MLVLTRKSREAVVVGNSTGQEPLLKVTVLDVQGSKVRLGFEAGHDVPIHRAEVWERIVNENSAAAPNQESGDLLNPTECFD